MSKEDILGRALQLSETAKYHHAGHFDALVPDPRNLHPEVNTKLRRWLAAPEAQKTGAKYLEQMESTSGRHLLKILRTIEELPEKAKNLPAAERQKLENAVRAFKNQLEGVLSAVQEYMNSILALDESRINADNINQSIEKDKQRRFKHNTLIDELNKLNRSLLWWFTDFDGENIANRELQSMYSNQSAKYIAEDAPKIVIDENGICPRAFNLKDRKHITLWAESIYSDLSRLHSDIFK